MGHTHTHGSEERFQRRLVFVSTEDPEGEWVTMAQWNTHQQAAIPQTLAEQVSSAERSSS